jgi:hypothetical protein
VEYNYESSSLSDLLALLVERLAQEDERDIQYVHIEWNPTRALWVATVKHHKT